MKTFYQQIMGMLLIMIPASFSISSFSQSAVKYNPGHYLAVNQYHNLNDFEFIDDSIIIGINKRYNWRDLEPQEGVYDFSQVIEDLNTLNTYDKQLVLFFIDKSFDGSMILPDYLEPYTIVDGSIVISNRWHPFVVERLLTLGDTLAKLVDSYENFEGIAIQESALSLSREVLDATNYSPEAYRDALIQSINGLSESFSTSRVIWYMNFFPRNKNYIYSVLDAVDPAKTIIAGPDILPYRVGLENVTYPVYFHYYGEFPLGCSVQWSGYQHHKNDTTIREEVLHPDGYIPMEEIYRFGIDSLKVNYIFWQYIPSTGAGKFDVYDAMPIIHKNPVFNCQTPIDVCETLFIKPSHPAFRYNGSIDNTVNDTSAILRRITSSYLANPSGFNPGIARTQSGISISFKTSSPSISFFFDSLSKNQQSNREFNLFRDGILQDPPFTDLNFQFNSDDQELHNYELYLPVLSGVVFKGIELVNGYIFDTPDHEIKPVYAAIGNSITHGVGQTGGPVQTYPFQLAELMGYSLHNFATGGSKIHTEVSENLLALPDTPDLISVLWGYNDAIYSQDDLSIALETYDSLLNRLARNFPDADVVGILQTYTTSTTGGNPDNSIDRLRTGQLEILKKLRLQFGNIRIVDGWELTNESDLTDVVHLNNQGAAKLASGIFERITRDIEFAPKGATWHYDERFAFQSNIDFIKFSVVGDTVILNKSCIKIEKRHKLVCYSRGSVEYIHTEGNKVYFWDKFTETFQLLYDFDARKGDSWTIPISLDIFTDTVEIKVDSVSYSTINENELLNLHVRYTNYFDTGPDDHNYKSLIVERVGDTSYMFNFYPVTILACDANWTQGLRCYQDDDIGLYETGLAPSCEYVVTAIKEPKSETIEIYPNPGSGIFKIRISDASNYEVQVFDSSGRIVFKENRAPEEVDLSAQPEGIFYLKIINRAGDIFSRKIVKIR